MSVLACVASVSCADITVNWIRTAAMRITETPINVSLPLGSLVQLIWSPDAVYAIPTAGAIPVAGGSYAGGDYVLWSQGTPANGGWTTPADLDGNTSYGSANVGGGNISLGYLYCFVFATNSANIVSGTMYGQSAMVSGPFGDIAKPPFTEPTVDASPTDNRMVLDKTGLTVQAVPEPGTLALLGIGLALVATRRLRK